MPKDPDKNRKKTQENLNSYAKYSGLAMQMIVVILVGVWAGKKLDSWMNAESPIFSALTTLLAVILAIYIAVKDQFPKKK